MKKCLITISIIYSLAKEQTLFARDQTNKQAEKAHLFQIIFNLEKKLAMSKNKAEIAQLKHLKAEAKQHYKNFGEEYFEI